VNAFAKVRQFKFNRHFPPSNIKTRI